MKSLIIRVPKHPNISQLQGEILCSMWEGAESARDYASYLNDRPQKDCNNPVHYFYINLPDSLP